jgi:hypothetical protein
MRHAARSRLRWIALAFLVAIPLDVLAQSAAPLSAEEETSLREIRDFVQATAERYGMLAPLEVSVASWVGSDALPQYASAPAVYTRGALYVNRRLLRASNRDLVIAKSLAYELLRAPSKATTLAERERERGQLGLDSNARTVDILVQVKGLSEEAAVEEMYTWLLAIHRAAGAGGRPPRPGSVTACDEIADLLRRYPGLKERYAGRECAPG